MLNAAINNRPLIATAFRDLEAARAALGEQPFSVAEDIVAVPHDTMWLPRDAPILQATRDITALLESYDETALADHSLRDMDREYMRQYLYMTNVRVANVADVLRAAVPAGARVLEIGSFFGSFSLALQRLGYRVTAVDRYDEFKGKFDAHVGLMEAAGVEVVRATRETEGELIEALPQFDVVMAMAVIEHIPHTPKAFLQRLLAKLKPGGLLALDTPNLTRFWNRQWMAEGKTIFQALDQQFECEPPWEGHHREFTADEMRWMLERVGCQDVGLKLFDYNMLQFAEIDRPHIACLESMMRDPSFADTILAYGRKPG